MIRLVASMPDFFAHAGDGPVRRGEAFGCFCGRCSRAVSAPLGFEKALIWCLYCGMEAGHVPAIDTPWGHRFTFGVTSEECLEDRQALDRGTFDSTAEARARREGRVVDLF